MDVQAQRELLGQTLDEQSHDFRYTLLNDGSPIGASNIPLTRTSVADWSVSGGVVAGDDVQIELANQIDIAWPSGDTTNKYTVDQLKVEIDDGSGWRLLCIINQQISGSDVSWDQNTTYRLEAGTNHRFYWDATPDTDASINGGLLKLMADAITTSFPSPFTKMRVAAYDADSGGTLIDSEEYTSPIGNTIIYSSGSNVVELQFGTGELGPSSATIERVTIEFYDGAGWEVFAENTSVSQALNSDKFKINNFTFQV